MELSNEELQECFQNYHHALYDDLYRDPDQMVLTVKSSKGKNLKILVDSSFTIYYVKLNIEYAYGRDIYPLEQQQVRHRGILLEDDVMLRETTVFDDGYLLLDMMSEKSELEEFPEVKETVTTKENGAKNEDVLVEKGQEKAPVVELAKKSNLFSEIAKQAGEIQKFPIQEEAEDRNTVSIVIDGHNRMNPHSVLLRYGSSVLSFNAVMVPNFFPDDAVKRDWLIYCSYVALESCQLVINEIDDYVATPLQPVKLFVLYLSSPDNKESIISSLKECLADSAIANNSILRLIGGIIIMHEQNYNEASWKRRKKGESSMEKAREAISKDTDHIELFRQESYFAYLFEVRGLGFYGAIDILTGESTLFAPRLSADYVVWLGEIKPPSYFKERYLVSVVYYTDEIARVLHDQFHGSRKTLLFLLHGLNTDSNQYAKPVEFEGVDKCEMDLETLHPILIVCRVWKLELELTVIQYANHISSEAHVEVMKTTRVGMKEYQLESVFLRHTYMYGGCRHCSYTCICATGENSDVLHYGHATAPNDRTLEDGDMALLDMGAENRNAVDDSPTHKKKYQFLNPWVYLMYSNG